MRSQDLHTRASYEHPRRTFTQAPMHRIFRILTQGPLEEDFNRNCTRSSHNNLYQIMKGHREDFSRTSASHKDLHQIIWQHFSRISTRSSHEDLWKTDLESKISMPGPRRESHKIVIKGPAAAGADLTRSWYKRPPRAPTRGFITSTSKTWHLQAHHARTS